MKRATLMVTDTVPRHTLTQHPCTNLPQRSARPASSRCSRLRSPSSRSRSRCLPHAPHHTPCRSARRGRRSASGQVAAILEKQAPGAFAITYYPGEAALRDAIGNRDVYGGISFGPDGRRLLIATGASPMVAQMLTQIGNGIAQHAGVPLDIEDLAPPTADDPRGARAGRIRAADHPGRTAACHRPGIRAQA